MARIHTGLLLTLALATAGPLASAAQASAAGPDELRIAVAANFKLTLDRLIAVFIAKRPLQATVVSGASGLLYGQILQGAPFDLFFSADSERPRQLERQGLIVPESRFTYACGVLTLWRPGGPRADSIVDVLRDADVDVLAIANPDTAPYGSAALQVLEHLALAGDPRLRIVRGESIGQAFQFVASGNAQAGFVALSQMIEFAAQNDAALRSEALIVDPALYEPIVQQAVQIGRSGGNVAAREFMSFVRSDTGRGIIREAGYQLPDESTGP